MSRRSTVLQDEAARAQYLSERAENAATGDALGAGSREPLLAGQQNNLYLPFITGAWRRASPTGAVALLHPDGFLSDPKAADLRTEAYRRYREYFHFLNELKLFTEIGNTRHYGVNVYGRDRGKVEYVQASFLYHPLVVDRSIVHDGTGELPGRKLATGEWDVRPHRERLVNVNEATLASWAALLAYDVAASTPVVKSVTSAEAATIQAIARYPHRVGGTTYYWSRGFNEYSDARRGLVVERSATVGRSENLLLQGPHIGICTPFAKQPRPSGRNQKDYEDWDLNTLPERPIPRTNWQVGEDAAAFRAAIPVWSGTRSTERFRIIARRQIPANTYRSVFAALLPPGPSAMGVCFVGAASDDEATVRLTGMLGCLLSDFFVRVLGASDLQDHVIARLPMPPSNHELASPLIHRTMRLNCLSKDYSPLWAALVNSAWDRDEFTSPETATRSIAEAPRQWDMSVPLRSELDRWLAFTEIDALGALILGVDPQGLEAVYRSQFPVLLGYEHKMVFDANGHQLCGFHHQHGYVQAQIEAEAKSTSKPGWRKIWDRLQDHLGGDPNVDLGPFVPPFRPASRVAAMTHAYWTFVDRYNLAQPESEERPAA